MSLEAYERETVITFNDRDEIAHVYTAQRPVITKLSRNPAATLKASGDFEGSPWATFEIPASLISFRRPMNLTDEQRAERGRRLASSRSDSPEIMGENEDNRPA